MSGVEFAMVMGESGRAGRVNYVRRGLWLGTKRGNLSVAEEEGGGGGGGGGEDFGEFGRGVGGSLGKRWMMMQWEEFSREVGKSGGNQRGRRAGIGRLRERRGSRISIRRGEQKAGGGWALNTEMGGVGRGF